MVCTSDVYFDDGYMPWCPEGARRVAEPLPVSPPPGADQPPGIPEGAAGPPPDAPAADTDGMADALHRAVHGTRLVAATSNKVLSLFSGPYARLDGVGAYLQKLGLEIEELDNHSTRRHT